MVDLEKERVLASSAVCEGGTGMCPLKSRLYGLGTGVGGLGRQGRESLALSTAVSMLHTLLI